MLSMTVNDATGAVTVYENVTMSWNAFNISSTDSATVEVMADIGGRKIRGNCIWEGTYGENCHVFQDVGCWHSLWRVACIVNC